MRGAASHPIQWGPILSLVFCLGLVGLESVALADDEPERHSSPALAEYERMGRHLYSPAVALPEDGLVLELAGARFHLNGTVRLAQPLRSGAVTGLVFEGAGRFEAEVPDETELHQLRRFAEDEELVGFDHPFDRLVLRSAAPEIVQVLTELARNVDGSAASDAASTRSSIAAKRHRLWLIDEEHDANMRVLAALSTLDDRYLRADLRLDDIGWLSFLYDARQREEIEMRRRALEPWSTIVESWLSLDRPADRRDDGKHGERLGGFSTLEHIHAEVDLRRLGRGPSTGFGDVNPIAAEVELQASYRSRHDGLGALVLQVHPMAELSEVREADSGRLLPFVRHQTGKLSSARDNRRGNLTFAVLLDEPLRQGETIELRFDYELELTNFAPGLIWYPRPVAADWERHTASLRFVHRGYYDVLASGRRVEDFEPGDGEGGAGSVWAVERPTKMVGFTFGRYPHQRRYEWDALPPTTVFGTTGGYLSAERIEELEPRVERSLRCLSELLDQPLETEELLIGLIAARHGQALEGFLQIDDYILAKGDLGRAIHGTKDLFIGHEIAHQWWGHLIAWDSYRDQWLSEAMAEYSAALCVGRTIEDGDKVFENILDGFFNEVTGSLVGAFNAFARPGLSLQNDRAKDRMGPIGHGRRSATRESPNAFFSSVYRKGALVLHMIAERLRYEAGGEVGDNTAMVELLRDLASQSRLGRLSTRRFVEVLEERVPDVDWQQMIDQWVLRAEIPTWRVDTETLDGAEGLVVRVTLEQENVDDTFRALVPLRIVSADGEVSERWIEVAERYVEIELPVTSRPRKVEVNPDHAVLARLRG